MGSERFSIAASQGAAVATTVTVPERGRSAKKEAGQGVRSDHLRQSAIYIVSGL